ncbi:MAG: PEGA domain-containing protein [Methanoregula sp.]|nr:PEGA domain-containing protein [Methanoregula sp.]
MKGSILLVSLILLFLLVGAGIPVAASPTVTGISPISAPNDGAVTATITGTGFSSYSTVWMTPASTCDPTNKIYGTDCSWSSTSGSCTFLIQGSTPGPYTVWVNSPVIIPKGNNIDDLASLSRHFEIYQGTGSNYITPIRIVPTTYVPPGPYGTIYVESSPPGAVVYLNDDKKGTAPVTISGLWPGSYTISAELGGYQKYTSSTTISGPTRSSVYCRLVPENTGNGLYVISNPDPAKVYLDGDYKGETPLMLRDTPSGSHTLQVRRSGYDEWKSTVEVPKSGTKTITAVMIQGDADSLRGISVSSNPSGADVRLDGLKKGVTPIALKSIVAGIHILEVEYPGYTPYKSTVNVPETDIKEISVNLTPKSGSAPGWIAVSSSPCNALVTLDGKYVGQTPVNSSLNLDSITPGEHTIGLALSGYKPYSTNATVSPNLISAINVTLIPVSGPLAKGALSVTSDPAGATISLDNNSIGTSPLVVNDIAVGNHLITITMGGYQEYSTSILVTAGTTSNVSATLLPVPPTLHSPALPLTVLGALGIIGFFILRKPE